MKKRIALLLAAAMLLSMVGCGGSAEPVETAPATTEPVTQVTEEPTEAPTEAPTTIITGAEECLDTLLSLGYIELNLDVYTQAMEQIYDISEATITPVSMEITQDGFVMELDRMQYVESEGAVCHVDPWKAYGTKGEELGVFVDLENQDYKLYGTFDLSGTDAASQIVQYADYYYYRGTASEKGEAEAHVTAIYYPSSGNLYNVVQECTEPPSTDGRTAFIFARNAGEYRGGITVETLHYGVFSFELHTFGIQYGENVSFYQYRPGMSLSDWACSELNTDGWIPWYGDTVLSPDRAYIADTAYLDMRDEMGVYPNPDNVIVAEEYDGSVNAVNNDYTHVANSPIDFGSLGTGASVSMMTGDQIKEIMEQNGLTSLEEVVDYINQSGTADMLVNSTPIAHMVNAKTPLFTPGFRIVGKKEGRAAYHSVEMGRSGYLLDDILDIYMNGIADELIPHIKLYAFPESEEFMATLESNDIFVSHPIPLEQGNEMLTIPENAVCLTFERVPDGQEAPNSPNPFKPSHENLNKDAVYARYVTKDDPNFCEGVNLVFAITFDDELVYWIHMGANFNETDIAQRFSMPY